MVNAPQVKELCEQFGIILEQCRNTISIYSPTGYVLGENLMHSYEVQTAGRSEEQVTEDLIDILGLGILPCEDPDCTFCR